MKFTLLSTIGQDAFGYVELYKNDEPRGKRTAVSVYYMPEGFKEHLNPRVAVTVLTELSKDNFTDRECHDIINSITDIIKINVLKFLKNPGRLDCIDTITLHISNIDEVSVITHGDFGIIK